MRLSTSNSRRRRLRQHARETRFAVSVLAVVGCVIALPAPASAQDFGGIEVPSEIEAVAGLMEPQTAPPEAPIESVMPPQAPAPAAPVAPAPVAPAPETAVPAVPATPPAAPAPPAAPVNVNVNIRILSPGDDGDVLQEIVMPNGPGAAGEPAGDAGQPDDPALDWDWTWRWIAGCEPGCAVPPDGAEASFDVDFPDQAMEQAFEQPPPVQEAVAYGDFALSSNRVARSHGPRPRPVGAARQAGQPATRSDPAALFAKSADPTGRMTSEGSDRTRATQGRRQRHLDDAGAPIHAPLALSSAAASGVAGGGFPAPAAAILLALLCLLAPRLLELAGVRTRTLLSWLSSSRLERPG
jgi:hypothetical protein